MPIRLFLRSFSLLTLSLLLGGCSHEPPPPQPTLAPELEGILVTSAAPVVLSHLQEQRVYLYFFAMECESCWKLLKQAEPYREQIIVVGIAMNEDNFAVYELARSHFIPLLPVYADHDGNIAYDYDVDKGPMWVSINTAGEIEQRTPTPPEEVLTLIGDSP
ncbi:MAG: hypothetical protein HN842_12225 [Gammaproteobacteria bacterium]|jgi:hypothetical protein|nr:hypothetical protein [Gammaproteobacteria bacterium]